MIDDSTTSVSQPKGGKTKSHEYTLDKRVFVVTPVYRNDGENTKDILTKLMREEARVKNDKPGF